jgi:hypothetical protein
LTDDPDKLFASFFVSETRSAISDWDSGKTSLALGVPSGLLSNGDWTLLVYAMFRLRRLASVVEIGLSPSARLSDTPQLIDIIQEVSTHVKNALIIMNTRFPASHKGDPKLLSAAEADKS